MVWFILTYVVISYLAFAGAAWHDAYVSRTRFIDEITPAHALAPVFFPLLVFYVAVWIVRNA